MLRLLLMMKKVKEDTTLLPIMALRHLACRPGDKTVLLRVAPE